MAVANIDRQHTQPADSDALITTGTDHSIPHIKVEAPNDRANNTSQPEEPESLEGSDTGMHPVPGTNVTSDNSDMQTKVEPMIPPGGESVLPGHQNIDTNLNQNLQQGTDEVTSSLEKLSASQEPKQEYHEAQTDKFGITHTKDKFQEYLIKKGLNYQPKGKWVETTDLQFCLSMYTDLDVLDEDNKFICQACTKQKQCTYIHKLATTYVNILNILNISILMQ